MQVLSKETEAVSRLREDGHVSSGKASVSEVYSSSRVK